MAICAFAPSMPAAHVCPRQGRRRPTPRFCVAGARRSAPSPLACRHAPAPGKGRWRPTWRLCAAGAERLKHVLSVARPARRYGHRILMSEGISLRWLTYHSADKNVNIYSFPLCICRAGPPQACAEIFTAGAGSVATVEACVGAAA
jgi:hypothetical protein